MNVITLILVVFGYLQPMNQPASDYYQLLLIQANQQDVRLHNSITVNNNCNAEVVDNGSYTTITTHCWWMGGGIDDNGREFIMGGTQDNAYTIDNHLVSMILQHYEGESYETR
jgi:hypothetical protein